MDNFPILWNIYLCQKKKRKEDVLPAEKTLIGSIFLTHLDAGCSFHKVDHVYLFVLFFNVSFCFVFIVFVPCLIFRNYFPVEVYMR